MAVRFLTGLGPFLARPGSAASCRSMLAAGAATRERRLLGLLEQAVFDHPGSPYRALFDHAGLDRRAVERLVTDLGVDSALARMHEAGVGVTLDEFKGRAPIRRGSLVRPVTATDFDNPGIRGHYRARSGGSRGTPTRLVIDLDALAHDACYDRELIEMFDLAARPGALWRPVPPAGAGLKAVLRYAALGLRWDRWFSQTPVTRWTADWKHTAFLKAIRAAGRLHGARVPRAEHVPVDRAATVARWLADCVARGTPGHLNAPVSSAVRVAQAAVAADLDLGGTFVRVGGEPLSPAKLAILERAGCTVRTQYAMSEAGRLGMPCGIPSAADDLHVMEDAVAIIERDVTTRFGERTPGLVLTTLAAHAPKVLLNVETGDNGRLSRRPCGCPWDRLGFTQHVEHIHSLDKLTSEGMHFVGTDLIALVEGTLPARFGGGATDYQFVEEEVDGLTRVTLVVHPRIGPLATGELSRVVLDALGGEGPSARLMADLWSDAGTIAVRRREPYLTPSGKMLTLHVRTGRDRA